MKILILGGTGMLGHSLWRQWRHHHDVWVTSRSPYSRWEHLGLFDRDRFLGGTEVTVDDALVRAINRAAPETIVNCIGIIKQVKEAHDPLVSLAINSMLPHRVAEMAQLAGARLIHVSTDCVFSGRTGHYTEASISDAEDLYGRTKYLGEVDRPNALTLRTSIIGREIETRSGLVEWFLSTSGAVRGFSRAIYTGFTTLELGRIMRRLIEDRLELHGVWQVSSAPINKFDLLHLIRDAFDHRVSVEPDPSVQIDRSLDSSRFRAETGYSPPSWPAMITELAADRAIYETWRHARVA
jgi:dTDP-4-dehydrorhamnose reductase